MTLRRAPWFPFLSLVLSTVGAAFPAGEYVGSNVCRSCHPDVWFNFFKNAHHKLLIDANAPPERMGCESCHGPGQAHVEARGGKGNIRAYSEMAPRQVIESCLPCHGREISRMEIRRSLHTQADVVCSNCHSIHASQTSKLLLAERQAELCYGCHANVRAQFAMPFKHRVNEGALQCTDCHNPHGAPSPSWTMGLRPRLAHTSADGEQPCLRCHTDKRGPFAFEHPAVRAEGCESCHSPHGSMNPRLLRRPAVFTLCLECHSGAGNFGRQGDGIRRQSASHNMNDPRYRNCTTCHVRIHGSNADPLFLR